MCLSFCHKYCIMTLPIYPSSISMAQINNEFGRGTDLNSYRGTTWYTDSGTSGTFPSSQIGFTDFYGKRKDSPTANFTISGNQTDLNLRTWALNNGWNGSSTINITISSGVYIYSSNTSIAALTIDGSWPGGVKLINNGYIIGKGGDGGQGGITPNGPAYNGTNGGTALKVSTAALITNNGTIGGGGGGGGGGGSGIILCARLIQPAHGGGGGGGAGFGTGGLSGYNIYYPQLNLGSPGSNGTAFNGGLGGTGGQFGLLGCIIYLYGGTGGFGGGLGSSGATGGNCYGTGGNQTVIPGNAGSSGPAIQGIGYVTWVDNFGTVYGLMV